MNNGAMTILAVATLAFSCFLPFALGEVDRYKMSIQEKGTSFSEQIEIDEKQDVEVFRVPAHNNVDGADFYHDFKMRVTVSRMLSRKVCYISEMDPSMSAPGKLKADFEQAAFQSGPLLVQEESSLVVITGLANRRLLTKEILVFCGALPIYNTEIYNEPSNVNGTTIIRRRRQKRDKIVQGLKSCLKTLGKDHMQYVKDGGCTDPHTNWDLSCRMERRYLNCFYYVTCHYMYPAQLSWNCTSVHKSARNPVCCDFVCP